LRKPIAFFPKLPLLPSFNLIRSAVYDIILTKGKKLKINAKVACNSTSTPQESGRFACFLTSHIGRCFAFVETGVMKKRRFIEAVIGCTLFCLAAPIYAITPRLHVDGNKIKDPNGNVVTLRGIDMMDLGVTQDWYGGATAMIDRITNKSDSQGNSPGWYPKIIRINITPPDSVSGWPHPFSPDNNDLYNLLRTVVNYCKTKDMYAIIDWHYIANTYDHVASTSQFWTYMAQRFANDDHVFFELFNESINTNMGDDTKNWLSVRNDMQTWINIVRTYAPDNIILVGGPSWDTTIGPAASYPLVGDDIVMVSHIYPSHWKAGNPSWYTNNITACAAVYPIIMTEWGFSQSGSPDPNDMLNGTITGYGQPLMNFREQYGISNTAWVASYDWGPPMFWTDWTLRIGEGEMGGFVKDKLYEKKDANQPVGVATDRRPIAYITSPTDSDQFKAGDSIVIDANAYDREGFVTKVEFYQGSTKLGEDTTAPYTLTWNNIPVGKYDLYVRATDNNGLTKTSPDVRITAYSGEATGFILREWWTEIAGTAVNNMTSDINYPFDPNGRELIKTLEGPVYWSNADNQGTRIRGYVYPPADGNYTFWIASDDSSQLLLSTDADPCHAVQIAYVSGWTGQYEWTKYPSQTSSPKALLAGHKYYIEVLHKQGGGGNLIAVAWQGPGITQQVIDGIYMSPYLYNFKDYVTFASQWLKTNCSRTNAWCSGADRDRDGNVQIDDLMAFAQWWLLDTN